MASRRCDHAERTAAEAVASVLQIADERERVLEERLALTERRLAESQLLVLQLTKMITDLTQIAVTQARHLAIHAEVLAPPKREEEVN